MLLSQKKEASERESESANKQEQEQLASVSVATVFEEKPAATEEQE